MHQHRAKLPVKASEVVFITNSSGQWKTQHVFQLAIT
jgi:hypothetical protein